jgi:hypothetical protein
VGGRLTLIETPVLNDALSVTGVSALATLGFAFMLRMTFAGLRLLRAFMGWGDRGF